MSATSLLWAAAAVVALLVIAQRARDGVVARAIRDMKTIEGVMAAYRDGDSEAALQKVEALRHGSERTAVYCYFRGSMLFHLGRLEEAEENLREGIPLEEERRQKALARNTLGDVLKAQRRFPEAIAMYEEAGRIWWERGAYLRGIAEVWLRQGDELASALAHARQAVDVDRRASGLPRDLLDQRIGEDLGVLAWAVAANGGEAREVESLLAEAFRLCGTDTKPILAELQVHAGRAYAALGMVEKSREQLRLAQESDPHGIFGAQARAL